MGLSANMCQHVPTVASVFVREYREYACIVSYRVLICLRMRICEYLCMHNDIS